MPDAFSADECARIVALAGAGEMARGTVYDAQGDAVDPGRRDVAVRYRPRDAETAWLYERLDRVLAQAAGALGVAVAALREPVQILRYDPGGHFRTWHSDAGLDAQDRRLLSLSVELSPLGSHEGGDLEIAPTAMGRRTLPQGGARIFPSRALHRVTPVIAGTRWALVGWTGAR